MTIIIQKFGGTSLADLDRIRGVANIVQQGLASGQKIVVVVSAMAGVTNSLITKCSNLSMLNDVEALKEYDAVIASGEIVTSALVAIQLQSLGIKAKSLQGWQVPIITDDVHGKAQILNIDPDKIYQLLEQNITPVITGFQGISDSGNITTLGKGGSDTSAAIIAAALKAQRCDVYTDVQGVYTADPRIVSNAQRIDQIHIDQLYILCASGAKILDPRAALAAKRYGFDLRILSSFNTGSGTTTQHEAYTMENRQITAITSNKNLLKITITQSQPNLTSIIQAFARENVPIEQTYNWQNNALMIIVSLSDKNKCEKLLNELQNNEYVIRYSMETNIASVTIVGYGIKHDVNLISSITKITSDNQIDILSSSITDISMTLMIYDFSTEKLIKLIHNDLF